MLTLKKLTIFTQQKKKKKLEKKIEKNRKIGITKM